MLPQALVEWLGTTVGRVIAGLAIAALVSGLVYGAVRSHDNKVIALHDAKIDKATTNATRTLRTSAARSLDPGVRGIRDPSTKDE